MMLLHLETTSSQLEREEMCSHHLNRALAL
jgi:hypothetical protein